MFYTFLSFKKAPLPTVAQLFIASVILSFIYQVFLGAFTSIQVFRPVEAAFASLINFVIIPIVIGVIYALCFDWIRARLSSIGIHLRHPVPNAWDQAFGDRTGCWVIVYLNDGAIVRGEFAGGAHASSTNSERNLYLETTYDYKNGEWVKPDRLSSVLIAPSSISRIEFVEVEKNEQ